ncbi:hypothetical protein NQ315_005456 [Exocentrus adspersus]|uniref:Uncharacterized protein n=1 Tax=Exocentrus adspersus TaxID=1586481 RepID=A0AAV8VTG9_9CUCU|nr:hypothetical protein NQ315_005456 [Exocentrus adspersus]
MELQLKFMLDFLMIPVPKIEEAHRAAVINSRPVYFCVTHLENSPGTVKLTATLTFWIKDIGYDFGKENGASEPNLLKVRLKQRVMERRCSPMSKRLPPSLKKKLLSSCLPPSDSPPQEPPKELSPPIESEEKSEEQRL